MRSHSYCFYLFPCSPPYGRSVSMPLRVGRGGQGQLHGVCTARRHVAKAKGAWCSLGPSPPSCAYPEGPPLPSPTQAGTEVPAVPWPGSMRAKARAGTAEAGPVSREEEVGIPGAGRGEAREAAAAWLQGESLWF